MKPQLSVIIPTLNEEHSLPGTLSTCFEEDALEVLVVDGGSDDNTLLIAQQAGAVILKSAPGRALQLNNGASGANGNILLFLHADTLLPKGFLSLVVEALRKPGVAGGAFSLRIDSRRKALRCISAGANLRSRLLGMPYGDQALFVRAETFACLGGFRQMEIMEDFIFMRSLRRHGKVVTLPQVVVTSARRWEKMGVVRTTLINQLMVCGYTLGVPTATLAKWYQRARGVREEGETHA